MIQTETVQSFFSQTFRYQTSLSAGPSSWREMMPFSARRVGVVVDHHTEHPSVQHVNEGVAASDDLDLIPFTLLVVLGAGEVRRPAEDRLHDIVAGVRGEVVHFAGIRRYSATLAFVE